MSLKNAIKKATKKALAIGNVSPKPFTYLVYDTATYDPVLDELTRTLQATHTGKALWTDDKEARQTGLNSFYDKRLTIESRFVTWDWRAQDALIVDGQEWYVEQINKEVLGDFIHIVKTHKFNDSIVIARPTNSKDQIGGQVVTYPTVWRSPAQVDPVSEAEILLYERLDIKVTHSIKIKYTSVPKVGDRLQWSGRYMRIEGVKDPDNHREFIVMTVSEGGVP